LNQVIINGRAYPSIWKQNTQTEKPQNIKHRGLVYKDPTANAALGNVEREEKMKKRMEQQATKRNKKRQK